MSHAGLSTSDGGSTSSSSTSLANNNSVGSGSGSGGGEGEADDRVALAQALLQRCLQKDSLLVELYVQLIKQVFNEYSDVCLLFLLEYILFLLILCMVHNFA